MTWIEDARATTDEATSGPWYAHDRGVGWMIVRDPDDPYGSALPEGFRTDLEREADARHIATFDPPTVAAMLDALEAAEDATVCRTTTRSERLAFGPCGECGPCRLDAKLARVRERFEGRP